MIPRLPLDHQPMWVQGQLLVSPYGQKICSGKEGGKEGREGSTGQARDVPKYLPPKVSAKLPT